MRRIVLPVALLLAAGCAPKPIVAIKPNYDFSKMGPVALIDPSDYPGQPGSGAAVSEGLEPYLLKAGYNLIERSQVQQILQEQSFSHSGAIDPGTAEQLGKVLGVNALILGTVTNAVQAQSSTYMETVQNTNFQPVYQGGGHVGRDGRVHGGVTQYDVVTTNDEVPETYTTPASISFTVKMVDVTTGQVLWTGSISSDGDSLADAATKASGRLMDALKKAWPVHS